MPTGPSKKDLVFLVGVNAPPLTSQGRREAGYYLNRVQEGEMLSLPVSRPMPSIGPRVHELRLSDEAGDWRVVYRTDPDEVVVVDVFKKTTRKTQHEDIARCRKRLKDYDAL